MSGMDTSDTQRATPLTPDSEAVRKVVNTIVDTVHPLRIVVFGSVARGTSGPYSDVDLLVIMPNGIHRRKTGQTIDRALYDARHRVPTDVVVATEEDISLYGDHVGMVYRSALSDGREVYRAA